MVTCIQDKVMFHSIIKLVPRCIGNMSRGGGGGGKNASLSRGWGCTKQKLVQGSFTSLPLGNTISLSRAALIYCPGGIR